jgi:hypothetical protein
MDAGDVEAFVTAAEQARTGEGIGAPMKKAAHCRRPLFLVES